MIIHGDSDDYISEITGLILDEIKGIKEEE
jgi:hypothetical protein